ncbi:MAG: magnesium transporter [Nocardioides sp.]|nr:magnesium transporter [Nocardioides sp.]
MEVRIVDASGAHLRDVTEMGREQHEGFWWVDVIEWSPGVEACLRELGCHEYVLRTLQQRNHVPTVHSYADHVLVTTQSPLLGDGGHMHLLELDLVAGTDYLVTAHGPLNPVVPVEESLVETRAVLQRIEADRYHPETPFELAYAIASAVARRQRAMISAISQQIPGLETQVMESQLTEPEELLERMFVIRHELITTRTMAAQCHDVWARMERLPLPDEEAHDRAADVADQFDRVRSIADGEAGFLFGVIELYQTKVNTKMTVAMERLAVIAAVTLPITAIASIEGMNMIVAVRENHVELFVVLLIMGVMSFWLLRWARRQGWW